MQKKIKILIFVVAIFLGFCVLRDFLIKSLIGTVAANVTGAPVRVGGFSLSVIRQTIKINDFKMYNPKGFPEGILVDIAKIGASYNLAALIKGKVYLKQVDFELKELGMVKNKEGMLNVDSLKIAEEKKLEAQEKEAKKPVKEMPIQIDLLNLAIGKVISKDYSVSGPPVIKVYDVNLAKSYKNITSVQQLAALIISEPLKAAGIKGLKVYAASMLTGVAALPVAAILTFTGKDYAQASFKASVAKAYDAGLAALAQMGKVLKEDKTGRVITAQVSGAKVILRLKQLTQINTEVTVSARKLGLPKPDIASGVIYQITEKLK